MRSGVYVGKTTWRSLAVAILLIGALATPAYAAPPSDSVSDDFFLVVDDFDNGVVVFWNITPEAFCAWDENGSDPPPIISPVPATVRENGNGNSAVTYHATSELTLERMLQNGDDFDRCSMTEPWASGIASVSLRDRGPASDSGQPYEFATVARLIGSVIDDSQSEWRYSLVANELFEGDSSLGSGLRSQLTSVGS